ncbi:uncharacterized protein LOC127847777 [Dreissena polymorpha]|uniref:uncharacterized protein LOC127847777 n=1 Tax=Dreissena polymorpha TaxID=45954 RepID=UPI002264206E|nr:uncharacterized protein LOC127847777 [Dreissena polymorpha]
MPHHCCVPLCTSDSRVKSSQNLSFHSFPKDESLKQKWVKNIRRDIGKNFNLNKHTRICSAHFEGTCYEVAVPGQVRRRLKKDALPTIFSWVTPKIPRRKLFRDKTPKTLKVTESGQRCVSGSSFMIDHSYSGPSDNMDYVIDDCDIQDVSPSPDTLNTSKQSSSTDDSLQDIEADPSPHKEDLFKQHKALLHARSKEKFTIVRFCSSDSDIRYYTGFPSYTAMCAFFHFLQPECNFLYYVGSENTSQGKAYEFVSKRGPSRSLSPLEELFLTLVRLRKGLPEKVIADLYNLSEGHISKIVNTWILFLFDRLRCLPIWPSHEQVRKTMPISFRTDYPDTRVIIDCTEIFIEQPSASVCQRETFSSYKHHNTAKGLVGIAPSGQITFISSLYAGRCSDKKIVRHCGLYDILEEGDSVMADKGFDIEEDLKERNLSLTIPPFLENQAQFTSQQLAATRNIAAVRVHVERAIRKVKEFEILRHTVPISLCPMLEKIWTVCAHLANFTGSLFKNK